MAFDGAVERAAIRTRLTSSVAGGRVHSGFAQDVQPERAPDGTIKPYVTVRFATPFVSEVDRSIGTGDDKQPHWLTGTVSAVGPTVESSEDLAGYAMTFLTGWNPNSPSSTAITSRGMAGYTIADPDSSNVRHVSSFAIWCQINRSL